MRPVKEQIEIIKQGTVDVIPEDLLAEKLERSVKTGTPLIIKQGFDPTAPDIHLGHTVGLRKLKQFQELGHQDDLADQGCNEVLVEAGTKLNGSLLQAGLVDELLLYVAPQLLGDMARGIARLGELTSLEQRTELEWKDLRHVGRDLRIVARVKKG